MSNNQIYNGRVNIMNMAPPPNVRFAMIQEMNTGNEIYSGEALKSVQEESLLSRVYFSAKNIELLQNKIRYDVYQNTQQTIGNQSPLQLKIIMRSIYLQHSKNLKQSITEQVKDLNRRVVEYAVSNILTNLNQYMMYKERVSTLPVPLEHSKNVSNKGTKSLMPNIF